MSTHATEYGSAPNTGLFGPRGLLFFAYMRSPGLCWAAAALSLLLGFFTLMYWAQQGDVWRGLLLAPVLMALIIVPVITMFDMEREKLRTRWADQLRRILGVEWGVDEDKWSQGVKDQYRSALSIMHRFTWLYHGGAVSIGPDGHVSFYWSNAAGDEVCMVPASTVEWSVTYAVDDCWPTTYDGTPVEDGGAWDLEFDPPRVLLEALQLVAP